MNNCDVIIIGAGVTGLMAAYKLTKAGKRVIVLEARDRPGGRVHTLQHELFFKQAELGAEFVHGDLPVTLGLLKEAGIAHYSATAQMWRYTDDCFTDDDPVTNWDELMDKLNQLREDCTINEFLQREFPGDEYAGLRKSVQQFAAGYDTADPQDASAFALRKEWQHEDEGAQYRIKGGYITLVNFLADACKQAGNFIYLNSVVTVVYHEPAKTRVVTGDGAEYHAQQILIALPLGVLKAEEGAIGALHFHPPINEYMKAIKAMGFGAVIKILLEFDTIFWEDKHIADLTKKNPKQMGFILSDQAIPTWWTQYPRHLPILTGWFGGPAAAQKHQASEPELLELALQSLANIFNMDLAVLHDKLVAFNCANWTNEPYTRGSYAYDTVAAPASRRLLRNPVNNTLFFAGEYLYEGPAMGTVEAALNSADEVSARMIGM